MDRVTDTHEMPDPTECYETEMTGSKKQVTGYLPVCILMVLLISGVIILLNEAKILLSLALQGQLPPLHVCWEITL